MELICCIFFIGNYQNSRQITSSLMMIFMTNFRDYIIHLDSDSLRYFQLCMRQDVGTFLLLNRYENVYS